MEERERIDGGSEGEGNTREENREGEEGGREGGKKRGREGEREGRKGGQGGTEGVKSSLFCFLNINTHMYGECDTTYKSASDSLTGPSERMCTR